jgi:3-methyladenine DNA glycosylase AlkD
MASDRKPRALSEPGKQKYGAKEFMERLDSLRSPEVAKNHRHLASDEADRIIGVRMGQVFGLAKEFIEMPLVEIEKLLESPIHEARVGAVSVMDWQARSKKTPEQQRKELFELYIRRHDRINAWDLVDRSAIYVVGGYLFDKPRDILYKLARSQNIWERRTAIVCTAYFIKKGEVADTYQIAEILLDDKEDLIHKATGWMLRAAGGVDRQKLIGFLEKYAASMPRTTLRYAMEHFDKEQRAYYLGMKKNTG